MAVKKEVIMTVKLQAPAGKASPGSSLGSVLGPKGINIMEFCKQFNALKFKEYDEGAPIPVEILVHKDKSFTLVTKQPPITYLIKLETKLAKGSQNPGKDAAGEITVKQLENVARKKMPDLNTKDLKAAVNMVRGSALSMGLKIVEEA
ncbi:MAG: 50S ribosomal protein L11 [Rickettsiales bacterium]|jgi:large subunit ribosomal protein L11|nr:50S ribosomal protein L11 [Rickettsiales bacterium]